MVYRGEQIAEKPGGEAAVGLFSKDKEAGVPARSAANRDNTARGTRESLKTLHIDLYHVWRGGQNQALLLMLELRRAGHQAELLTLAGSPLEERARAAAIRVYTVAPFAGRALAALRLLTLNGRFDIVHCHEAHGVTSVWLASLLKPVPYVVSMRIVSPLSRWWPARLPYLGARRIIAVSAFVKDSVVATGYLPDEFDAVYDGVEVPVSPAQRLDGKRIGCVGWLLPEKNQELLIRAFPKVLDRFPQCHLILAGKGVLRTRLERLAQELGISGAVQFLGFVRDVAALYKSLDIFVFPSMEEPLGSSLLEAMAWGLPVVGLASGGVPEVIEHERNGLLVLPGDSDRLAEAIIRLLRDGDLCTRLGRAARQTIEERFSARTMMEKTLDIYCRVV